MGLVFVHGAVHDASCWNPVLAELRTPAVAVDLPSRGSEPADIATVTLADCVGAVVRAADRAGFETFGLVGHSLGGVTITETAVQHPARVDRLIYVGATVPGPGASAAMTTVGADMPEDAAIGPELVRQMVAYLTGDVEHRTIAAGHLVMVSHPRELAALIDNIVG